MNQKQILVVGPAWVGDMVMVQSLFMTLKEKDPDSRIDVIAPSWSAPVLSRMPEIRKTITVDIAHGKLGFRKRLRVGKSLRGIYDQAIILPGSFKSALIPFFAKIRKRTAFRGEMRYGIVNDIRKLDKAKLEKAVDKFAALGVDRDCPSTVPATRFPGLSIDVEKRSKAAKRLRVPESKDFVALMPGAEFGPSKRWPAEYFGKIASLLANDGYDVFIFGSSKDKHAGEVIVAESNGHARNLCGETKLEEVIDLISLAKLAITNDSGLMHIAAAVGRPVVAIYGAITPQFTPPLTDKAEIQYLGLDCSPCWKKQCPFGHYDCLRKLTVKSVYESATKLMIKN